MELSKETLLPQKVRVESAESERGKVGEEHEPRIGSRGSKRKQRGYKRHAPALDEEGVTSHSVDDTWIIWRWASLASMELFPEQSASGWAQPPNSEMD